MQLYRYNDRDGKVVCISCVRGGVTSHAVFDAKMSGDGSTVAFSTAEALVPRDVNRSTDIYEWRNGAVRLITDGVTTFQAGAAIPRPTAVDRSGRDIFFTVDSPGLTGYEQDGLTNLYDAREEGGFPPPTPPVHCTEDSCQGSLLAAPLLALSNSLTFTGPGNLVAAPVVKPKAKALTRAQKLAAALKACRKKAKGKRRAACERQARKRVRHESAKKARSKKGSR